MYLTVNEDVPSTTVNCVITGNTAWRGGGVCVEGQIFAPTLEPILVNLSLSGNPAYGEGSGIHTNTTIYSPRAAQPARIENSILWNNGLLGITSFGGSDPAVLNYSIIEGGRAGPGRQVLTDNPIFVDANQGNVRLNLDSPAIDAGDNTVVPIDEYDADGDHWGDGFLNRDRNFRCRFRNLPYIPNTGVAAPDEWPITIGAFEASDTALIFENDLDSGDFDPWSDVPG